ncbi:hypothetical protein OEZ86_009760 [Tetradesmus obliquus]|uniref:Aminotransferase class V domain-containing protein n=1 Tax=Tetradesmus obliquus TaxID=3088 RepID=A0ABY8UMN5_TETOB|nr:hypothetical protein OEZ85_001202 [Tetradesmus obliquus]WIA43257.1 hypothetical protein OEZ86_009760 [Tetradesmus obliquus]
MTPTQQLFRSQAQLAAASSSNSSSEAQSSSCFGDAAKGQFLIDFSSWTFINHGAFGGVAEPVYRCAELWRRHCELQPLRFIDRELFPQLVRVIRELAAFVNCRPQDLVLLPNATTGLNAVISSCKLQPGDTVYSLNIGYGSVKKMLQAACDAAGASHVVGEVTFPLSGPEQLLEVMTDSLPQNAKLAVFDAVTSNTALVLPIKQLVQLCKDRGVPVLIDGAHALGMLPLDLQQLDPDFFVSNCHKWLCGARGSAMLYVAPQWQQQVQPPVLSHGAEAGFLSSFIWDGCRDYAPLLAIATAIQWWKGLGMQQQQQQQQETATPNAVAPPSAAQGGDSAAAAAGTGSDVAACCDPSQLAHPGDGGAAARCYMYRLLHDAAELLMQRWGSGCLGPPSMTAAMVLVGLPAGGLLPQPGQATSTDAKHVQDLLHSMHSIEVPIKTIQGSLYVRISAHVYNTLAEYEQLTNAVQQMQQQQQQQQE